MGITSTAAIAYKPDEPFVFESVELEDPRSDEILVRIEASGVCHTDAHAQHMLELPAVLGHEGTGIVEAVGKGVDKVKVGDTVIISYPSCGTCPNCAKGKLHICDYDVPMNFAGTRLDGSKPISLNGKPISSAFFQQSSFATHAITLERDVVVVNDAGLTPSKRGALPCGVLTGAGAVINTFDVSVRDTILIAGAGAVGLSAVMAAKLTGAFPIVVVDVVDSRLELAKELGATHVLNGKEGDLAERVKEIVPRGVDFALDTTANEHVVNGLIASLTLGGTCGLVFPPHIGEAYPFNVSEVFFRASSLKGIFLGDSHPGLLLPRLIEFHAAGLFPYEQLIKEYDFEDINKAFADSANGEVIKPVLLMH